MSDSDETTQNDEDTNLDDAVQPAELNQLWLAGHFAGILPGTNRFVSIS